MLFKLRAEVVKVSQHSRRINFQWLYCYSISLLQFRFRLVTVAGECVYIRDGGREREGKKAEGETIVENVIYVI
jgi:hypothetical protein